MKLVATHSNVHAADLVTTPRRAPNADRGWTVFEIPSTPGSPTAVGSATCGPDRARLARAGTRSSSSDVVSQRAGSQQWRLRSSIGEGEKLRAERVSRRLLGSVPRGQATANTCPRAKQTSRSRKTSSARASSPRTRHGGVALRRRIPSVPERARKSPAIRCRARSFVAGGWTRRPGLCVGGARWTPSSAASTPGCGCR